MSACASPLVSWLESYRRTADGSISLGNLQHSSFGDGGRQAWTDFIFGPVLEGAEARITLSAAALSLRTGNLGSGQCSISLSAKGALYRLQGKALFPLVSWIESFSRGSTDLITAGWLQHPSFGDGGRQAWTDWVFGSNLAADARITITATATELKTGLLGPAIGSIPIQLKGSLVRRGLGVFPIVSWLEQYKDQGVNGSITTGVIQNRGLGDGGRGFWTDWVFTSVFEEAEARMTSAASAATLRLGLGTASATCAISIEGSLVSRCVWNVSDTYSNLNISNRNLTVTTISPAQGDASCRSTVSHRKGKFYFEVYVNAKDRFSIGIAKQSMALTDALGWSGDSSYGYISHGAYYYNSNTVTGPSIPVYSVVKVALDLDNGKLWFGVNDNWRWGGSDNPATGINPAFSGLSGDYFAALTTTDATLSSKLTARFKASEFTYPPPDGFVEWQAFDSLSGDAALSVNLTGALLKELAGNASITMTLAGELQQPQWALPAGEAFISISADGVLSQPITLLPAANANLSLLLDATGLGAESAITTTHHLAMGLNGALSQPGYLPTASTLVELTINGSLYQPSWRSHQSCYTAITQRLHLSCYSSALVFAEHHAPWGFNSASWNFSIYETYSTTALLANHRSVYQSNKTEWRVIHHSSQWESFIEHSAYAYHSTSWEYFVTERVFHAHAAGYSTQSQSVISSLHSTAWSSWFYATPVFTIHQSLFESTSLNFNVHQSAWKSITNHYHQHDSQWSSGNITHRGHAARYYSVATAPLFSNNISYIKV